MKKGAFSGLLYREWVLVKKSLVIMIITSLSAIVLSFLVVLSFRYGNLALLDEKLKAAVFGDFAFVVKALPVLAVITLVSATSDSAVIDTNIKWERFRRTTPASCIRLALAKYTILAALTLLAAGGALGVMALMCAAMDTAFTANDAAVSLVLLAAVVIFSVSMQVAVTYFKSSDKAGLAVSGVTFAVLFPIIAANRDIISADNSAMSSMERLASRQSPLPVCRGRHADLSKPFHLAKRAVRQKNHNGGNHIIILNIPQEKLNILFSLLSHCKV